MNKSFLVSMAFLWAFMLFTVFCADTSDSGMERTKGDRNYHIVRLSRAQTNHDKSREEYKTEKSRVVDPSQKATQERIIDDKRRSSKIYRDKSSLDDLENNRKLPGLKKVDHIYKKDKAKAQQSRAGTSSSSNDISEKPRTKGDSAYHLNKYKENVNNMENTKAELETARKKLVTPGLQANEHSRNLAKKEQMIDQFDGKAKKNASAMYHLQSGEKLPGPKNLKHFQAKQQIKTQRALEEKPKTKGTYQYHDHKARMNDNKKKNVEAELEVAKKKQIPSGPEALNHANQLSQHRTMIRYYNGKSQKNLASMYQLEKDEKLPGPKDLNHIKAKEEAKAAKEQARKERRSIVN